MRVGIFQQLSFIFLLLLFGRFSIVQGIEFVDVLAYNRSAQLYESQHHHQYHNTSVIEEKTDVKSDAHLAEGGVKFLDNQETKINSTISIGNEKTASDSTESQSALSRKEEDSLLSDKVSLIRKKDSSGLSFLDIRSNKKSKNIKVDTANEDMKSNKMELESKEVKDSKDEKKISSPDLSQTSPVADSPNPKVVLITGVTGMLGSSVLREILSFNSYTIFGLVRDDSALERVQDLITNFTIIHGDITDPFRMNDVMNLVKPQIVLHLAGQSSNLLSIENPHPTIDVNIKGTLNIMEALLRNELFNTRVFIASTWSVYGHSVDSYKSSSIPENAPLQPTTSLGLSKSSAEQLAMQYFYNYKIPVVVGRLFFLIGKGSSSMTDSREFCQQLALIETGKEEPLIIHKSNLNSRRDIIHVDDAAKAVIKIVLKGTPGTHYNIGSGEGVSTKAIFAGLAAASSVSDKLKVQFNSQFKMKQEKVIIASISRLKEELNWEPTIPINKALKDEMSHWRKILAPSDKKAAV